MTSERPFNRVLEHTPEDMTVTVEAGVTLAALQQRLAESGQWLPLDPPNPETATMADILNFNRSGPRRFGFGTIREHLIGIAVVLADGRLIHNGGKVVKNVAGYDLCKLFVGSGGSLGRIVQATFKVRPLPESEQFVSVSCDSLSQAAALLDAIHDSELTPVVVDLHNVGATGQTQFDASTLRRPSKFYIVLGIAGTQEDVAWQLNKAAGLGLGTPANLQYEKDFWSAPELAPPHRLSVLPSRLTEAIQSAGATEIVARAGNGVIYYRGGKPPPQSELPTSLMKRIKDTYDRAQAFPNLLPVCEGKGDF
jgi:glycolate oxidase FAD binding subunit